MYFLGVVMNSVDCRKVKICRFVVRYEFTLKISSKIQDISFILEIQPITDDKIILVI